MASTVSDTSLDGLSLDLGMNELEEALTEIRKSIPRPRIRLRVRRSRSPVVFASFNPDDVGESESDEVIVRAIFEEEKRGKTDTPTK